MGKSGHSKVSTIPEKGKRKAIIKAYNNKFKKIT